MYLVTACDGTNVGHVAIFLISQRDGGARSLRFPDNAQDTAGSVTSPGNLCPDTRGGRPRWREPVSTDTLGGLSFLSLPRIARLDRAIVK